MSINRKMDKLIHLYNGIPISNKKNCKPLYATTWKNFKHCAEWKKTWQHMLYNSIHRKLARGKLHDSDRKQKVIASGVGWKRC